MNFYCDESCHLETDGHKVMVLGAVICPQENARQISLEIRALKKKHNLERSFEAKWGKVSPSKKGFYLELVDLFFRTETLSFRGLIVPDKTILRHSEFNQSHDDWYYKMYYYLLRQPLKQGQGHRAFLDIKDTKGGKRVQALRDYLRNYYHDSLGNLLTGIQIVVSEEVALMQIADILIGALSYLNRGLSGNAGKEAVIARIREHAHLTLYNSTAPGRPKFDLFVWRPDQDTQQET